MGITKGGGGCGVYCGGVELAEIWRTKLRAPVRALLAADDVAAAAAEECTCKEPARAMAPLRGGIAGGGPAGKPRVLPIGGEECRLSVEVCEGTRGGNCGKEPVVLPLLLVRLTGLWEGTL